MKVILMKMMIKANEKLVYSMEGLNGLPLLSSHFLQAIEENAFSKTRYTFGFLIT